MSDLKTSQRWARIVYVQAGEYPPCAFEVVINQGAHHGIKLGGRFLVIGTGPHIADPDTGEDLGALEIARGQDVVAHVQDKLSTIRTTGRRRTRAGRHVIRKPGRDWGLRSVMGYMGNVIEEELPPEEDVPLDSVQLGDFAKQI